MTHGPSPHTQPAATVDVLLTVYRRTAYLDECIKSVLAQTREDLAITVLDDGNCPKVASIIGRSRDPRIRHNVNPNRLGISGSVFSAIMRSRSKYFSIINDDDYWHPEFLAALLPPLEHDESIGLAFCDHWLVDSESKLLTKDTDLNSLRYGRANLKPGIVRNLTDLVLLKGIPMAMGAIVRRSCIQEILLFPHIGSAYDFWLSLLVSDSGARGYYCPRRLSYYRVHEAMETASNVSSLPASFTRAYASALINRLHRKHSGFFIKEMSRHAFAFARHKLIELLANHSIWKNLRTKGHHERVD